MKFLKKNKSLLLSLGAVVLGIGLGFLFLSFTKNVQYKTLNIISPIQNVFINVICYLAVPLMFICLSTSIYNMGNIKTFGKTGVRTILQYILLMFVLALCAGIISSLIFGLKFGDQTSELSSALSLLKNFKPKDLWTPFIERNILQVNLFAIITGITFMIIGEPAKWIVDLLTKINKFIIKIFSYLGKLVPVYILISMIKIVLIQDKNTVTNLWKLIGVFLLLILVMMLIYFVRTLIITKGKDKRVLLKAIPPFIIALSSANSTLALDRNLDVSKNVLNEKDEYADFAIPLSMMLYKSAGVMYLAVVAPYFAMLNGMPISFTWLISLALICTLLNIAIPPVNGGGINSYSILLTELSLPLTPLPLLIVLDSVMEFIITGFNVYGQTLETYCIAKTSKNTKE